MNALKGFEPAYVAKYEALADFYEQYEIRLKSQGLRDSQDALRIFRERKRGQAPFSLAEQKKEPDPKFKSIWIDGFFDFSNLQLEYLRELSVITENITITLTKEAGGEEAFEAVSQTQRDLEKIGFKVQAMKAQSHRTEKPALLFLQKNIFKGTGSPPQAGCLSPLAREGQSLKIGTVPENPPVPLISVRAKGRPRSFFIRRTISRSPTASSQISICPRARFSPWPDMEPHGLAAVVPPCFGGIPPKHPRQTAAG
jgi:hypothetical protein